MPPNNSSLGTNGRRERALWVTTACMVLLTSSARIRGITSSKQEINDADAAPISRCGGKPETH